MSTTAKDGGKTNNSKFYRAMFLGGIFSRLRPRHDDLVIFDDIFPHQLSPFRLLEFNSYLSHFRRSSVYSTGGSLPLIGESRPLKEIIKEFETNFKAQRGRTFVYRPLQRIEAQLTYTVFLNNADFFFDAIVRIGAPFLFTLYPGGGFRLECPESDEKLRRITTMKSFRKVIVTQNITRDYLLKGAYCSPEQIEFIYGGVFPIHPGGLPGVPRPRYQESKRSFDICFVAHKYTPQGRDKGYDVFIEAAKKCRAACPDAKFHVVGPFAPEDFDIGTLEDRITFYGMRTADFFSEFYANMDIILSPNAPFLLQPGAFDGFPTGCCIEAGMSGVAVMATDCLNQNVTFRDGEDIVIIPRDADAIAQRVAYYYDHPPELYVLAERGKARFREVFAVENQMMPRYKIMENLLGC